jgi:hypothetical protein
MTSKGADRSSQSRHECVEHANPYDAEASIGRRPVIWRPALPSRGEPHATYSSRSRVPHRRPGDPDVATQPASYLRGWPAPKTPPIGVGCPAIRAARAPARSCHSVPGAEAISQPQRRGPACGPACGPARPRLITATRRASVASAAVGCQFVLRQAEQMSARPDG